MKFYNNQLPNLVTKIANGDIKALMLYGPNRGFISAIINQLVNKLNLLVFEATEKDITARNLQILANSKNFFQQRELLKIDYKSSAFNKDLKEFFSKAEFTNVLCFVCGESMPSSGIRKFFETEKNLAILSCYYNDEKTINQIALSIAARHKKNIDQDALFYIRDQLKGDNQLIKNELEKLIYYAGDNAQISYDDAVSVISKDLSANGDEMCTYFATQRAELFLEEVTKLKNQNINEILMIRALIRYYINLFIVVKKLEDGQLIDQSIKALSPPIFFKYVADFKNVAQKLSSSDVLRILNLLQQSEVSFKKNANNFDFFNELYLPAYGELFS